MNVATALTRASRGLSVFLAVSVFGLAAASGAAAQGVTTGAVRGVVQDEAGQPVTTATVTLVAIQTGQRYQTITQTGGRFFVANVQVGRYSIEARAIGYRPVRQEVAVSLNLVTEVALRMPAATVELEAITVQADPGTPLISASRTGAATAVSDSLISRLPSINRDFTDFVQMVPQVNTGGISGLSIGGQTNRSNNVTIDGAVNNDLFALSSSEGTPGGRSDARMISVDAIREFQVQVAPFDVRFGGFTGGLVNAVTRSGTNQFSGSLFGYTQGDSWVGKDSAGGEAAEFSNRQYGFTIGGPIIRDRLHFFVSGEHRADERPSGLLTISATAPDTVFATNIGISQRTARTVRQIAIDSLGFDPGDFGDPTQNNPNDNLFVKLNWAVGPNSQVELSYNYVDASNDILIRAPFATGGRDGYELTNSGYQNRSSVRSWRGRWNVALGSRITNELLVSSSALRDPRPPSSNTTLMFVGADLPNANVAIGAERFSHSNVLNQDIVEVTDNVTVNLGNHVITFGTQNQFFTFYNDFFPASRGVWNFTDTAAFRAMTPSRFEIALPLRPGGPLSEFSVQQLGFYVQDQFQPSSRFQLTAGLRLDVPFLDRPGYNRTLDSVSSVDDVLAATGCGTVLQDSVCSNFTGINTTDIPTGNLQFSPRVGFSYDVRGNGELYVRGGIGLFTGRPPYVFVSNGFANSGVTQATLICDGGAPGTGFTDTIPVFTADAANQPQTCLGGAGTSAPVPSVVYFEPDVNYPQNLRMSLGADRRLPWDLVGTFDFTYTKTLNQFYLTDVNLRQGGTAVGEGARPLYGTLSGTSSGTTPRRKWTQARDVIQTRNTSEGYSYSLSFQLQRRFSRGLELAASYTFSRTRDLVSFGSDIANSNLRFSPLAGTLEDRELTTSRFDIPHSVKLSATANVAYGVVASLFYVGRSGLPFTYTVNGDPNADGLFGNDLVYVPLHGQDISLCPATGTCTATTPNDPGQVQLLDNFINSQQCLRERRGMRVERNSCRDPWQSFVNARLAKVFRLRGAQGLELSADIFNVMSFLGVGGQVRSTGGFEATNMLSTVGYNSAFGRSRYRLALPQLERPNVNASRWRLMLGGRLFF